MIKASDALDITVEKAAELIERDITDIEAAVYTAANKGSAHCIYYRLMSRQTQDYLRQLGYTVKDYSNQKDGPIYRIQWDGRA